METGVVEIFQREMVLLRHRWLPVLTGVLLQEVELVRGRVLPEKVAHGNINRIIELSGSLKQAMRALDQDDPEALAAAYVGLRQDREYAEREGAD